LALGKVVKLPKVFFLLLLLFSLFLVAVINSEKPGHTHQKKGKETKERKTQIEFPSHRN
jgi:hypothetical protein